MKELRASARGYARVDLPDPGGLLCRPFGPCREFLLAHTEYSEDRGTHPAIATRSLLSFGSLVMVSSEIQSLRTRSKRRELYLLVILFGNFVDELFRGNLHDLDTFNDSFVE